MNSDNYQTQAARTLIDEPDPMPTGHEMMILWCAIGLAGEAGEVCEIAKKGILHQHGLDTGKLIDECGDLLWYLSGICTLIGVPLSEVMERNITKLKLRYPNGYASADSKARVDVVPERLCDRCHQPLDNLRGEYVMRKSSYDSIKHEPITHTATICHRCHNGMLTLGYTVVLIAK